MSTENGRVKWVSLVSILITLSVLSMGSSAFLFTRNSVNTTQLLTLHAQSVHKDSVSRVELSARLNSIETKLDALRDDLKRLAGINSPQ